MAKADPKQNRPTTRRLEDAVEFSPYSSEPRCPCVLLLDTSKSMEGEPIAERNAALKSFRENLLKDPVASKRVDVALVTFNSEAQVVQVEEDADFIAIDRFAPPELMAEGLTRMGTAILKALELLQAHKKALRELEIEYFRPHIFLITDGRPEGEADAIVEQAAQRIREEERAKRALIFGIGVRNADMNRLRQIVVREPIDMKDRNFHELIEYLSRSVAMLSQAREESESQIPMPPAGARRKAK